MKVKSIYIANDDSEWEDKNHAIARDEFLELKEELQEIQKQISNSQKKCNHPVVRIKSYCIDEESNTFSHSSYYYSITCSVCEKYWNEEQTTSEFYKNNEGRTIIRED